MVKIEEVEYKPKKDPERGVFYLALGHLPGATVPCADTGLTDKEAVGCLREAEGPNGELIVESTIRVFKVDPR